MKTTVEISDDLLAEARQVAAQERRTLRELVECGLRGELERRRTARREPFRLRDAGVGGRGLRPEIAERGWEGVRAAAYEGRGA